MDHTEKLDIENAPQTEGTGNASAAAQEARIKLWMELLKTCFFLFAALAALAFGSLAWFVSSRHVQSGSASIAAQQEIVKIASKGVRQTSETNFLKLENGTPHEYGGNTYYYTDGGEIALRLSEEHVVSPGARGSIEFFIIPTHDGAAHITLLLGMAGYQEQEDNTVAQVTDPTLDALLSGHILLFRTYENGHYSGWLNNNSTSGILNNTITIDLPGNTQTGVPYPVTLYWIWPLRYENMLKDLYDPNSTEYTTRFQPFIQAQATDLTRIDDTNYYYSRIFLANETSLETAASRTKAYNLADEYIGTNADYLYLTIQTVGFLNQTT